MPINFPDNPLPGQEYTVGEITWIWNGTSWDSKTTSDLPNYYDKAKIFMLMGA